MGVVNDDGRCVLNTASLPGDASPPPPGPVGLLSMMSPPPPDTAVPVMSEGVGGSSGTWICRAVVLGYVVEGGGVLGGGEDATAPATHYLVEVETLGETGDAWACYKR